MNSFSDDKSDRKSLDLLVANLIKQKEYAKEIKYKPSNSSKYKQLSVSTYYSPNAKFAHSAPPKKLAMKSSKSRKKSKSSIKTSASDNTKLTGWLSKSKKENLHFHGFDEISESKENTSFNNKKTILNKKEKKSEQYKEAFSRYGMKLPSYEDIVKFQKISEAHKQVVDNIKSVQLPAKQFSPLKLSEDSLSNLLDCKLLSPDEIKDRFYQSSDYARNILNGIEYNERHEKFKCENMKDNYTIKDLRYSPSLSVFTVEQKEILLSLMHEEFDNGNPYSLNQYYFKVLLPEICLKIFMDLHQMDKDEAVDYLEHRPVDD